VSSAVADSPRFAPLVWPHVRSHLGAFSLALVLALALAARAAQQPLLTRLAIDGGLLGRDFTRLAIASVGMLGVALAGVLLGAVHRVVHIRASAGVLFALRDDAYAHLLAVAPRSFDRQPIGELVSRLDGDVAEVQRFATDSVATLISNTLTLLLTAAVLCVLSWQLALVVAAVQPLQLVIRHRARARIESTTRDVRSGAARIGSFLVETLSGVRAVQAAAAEPIERAKLAALNHGYLDSVLRQQRVVYRTGAAAHLTGHLAAAAVFLAGGWAVLHDAMTVGTLIAFVTYLGRVAAAAGGIVGLYTAWQRARVSLERVVAVYALPTVSDAPGAVAIGAAARGELRLQGVRVSGRGDGRPALDQIDLLVRAGEKLVLGGDSGAGKSTLVNLLRRFVEPDAGRILLDGRPLTEYRLRDLRRRIVIVEHSPFVFRGTLRANLCYGHASVSDAEMHSAARHAGVDEFARRWPQAYDTPIGEGGADLSTGQRQRLAIARALLADPLIVILDEATSGIDRPTARAIHAAIDEHFAARTRIIVTHHVDHVASADRRLRLALGRLEPVPSVG
jgi:ATP-binding cassette subfamily B protein